jgi:hypothetical protein
MRDGLPGAKAEISHLSRHPVEIIQEQARPPGQISRVVASSAQP